MTNIIEKKTKTIDNHTSEILKVLSAGPRRKIIELLKDGEHCVCHMEAFLGYRQAYLSQQLKVLKDAGVIVDRREGWNVYYRVIDKRIFTLLESVYQYTGQEMVEIKPYDLACPCPKCNPT
ncbi:MAG: metalloregulator ArsR/SmtB family transcription factor [Anaerolineaceae bacterium]|nr:metalloregulator ArsR/SmtB family transcription factor [Anaerolineaceae bacterium]